MSKRFNADLDAAHMFVEGVRAKADSFSGGAPLWHGWALRLAFLAGADHGRGLNEVPPVEITKPMELPHPWPSRPAIVDGALGMTCPILKIALHYSIDYGVALWFADTVTHNRFGFDGISIPDAAADDIIAVAHAFYRLKVRG